MSVLPSRCSSVPQGERPWEVLDLDFCFPFPEPFPVEAWDWFATMDALMLGLGWSNASISDRTDVSSFTASSKDHSRRLNRSAILHQICLSAASISLVVGPRRLVSASYRVMATLTNL